jgi:hypothetical protein
MVTDSQVRMDVVDGSRLELGETFRFAGPLELRQDNQSSRESAQLPEIQGIVASNA